MEIPEDLQNFHYPQARLNGKRNSKEEGRGSRWSCLSRLRVKWSQLISPYFKIKHLRFAFMATPSGPRGPEDSLVVQCVTGRGSDQQCHHDPEASVGLLLAGLRGPATPGTEFRVACVRLCFTTWALSLCPRADLFFKIFLN